MEMEFSAWCFAGDWVLQDKSNRQIREMQVPARVLTWRAEKAEYQVLVGGCIRIDVF